MKPLITVFGICAFLLAGNAAVAQPDTHYWDNEDLDNSYWSSGDNWEPDAVPGDTDDVILDETYVDSPYTVELRSSDTIDDLYMRDGDANDERVTLEIGDSSNTTTPVTLTCDVFTVDAPNQNTFVEVSRANSVTATCKISAETLTVAPGASNSASFIVTDGAKIETR